MSVILKFLRNSINKKQDYISRPFVGYLIYQQYIILLNIRKQIFKLKNLQYLIVTNGLDSTGLKYLKRLPRFSNIVLVFFDNANASLQNRKKNRTNKNNFILMSNVISNIELFTKFARKQRHSLAWSIRLDSHLLLFRVKRSSFSQRFIFLFFFIVLRASDYQGHSRWWAESGPKIALLS